jgi:hypothetical protein
VDSRVFHNFAVSHSSNSSPSIFQICTQAKQIQDYHLRNTNQPYASINCVNVLLGSLSSKCQQYDGIFLNKLLLSCQTSCLMKRVAAVSASILGNKIDEIFKVKIWNEKLLYYCYYSSSTCLVYNFSLIFSRIF